MGNEPIIMTEVDHQTFNNSDTCYYIYNESFWQHRDGWTIPSLKGEKFRDHWHYAGQFRGASHNGCNLQLKKIKDILP